MKCPQCQADNDDSSRFCEDCGALLALTCQSCGAQVRAGKKFCGACGASLESGAAGVVADLARSAPHSYPPAHLAERILTSRSALEGERKQVTVLFCDIASSTVLAERVGAEAMHGVLNRFFKLALSQVHRYEGTINQFLGDGFMALFGAPVAHEDHARRAVLAALGIQSSLRDSSEGIEVRMGPGAETVDRVSAAAPVR